MICKYCISRAVLRVINAWEWFFNTDLMQVHAPGWLYRVLRVPTNKYKNRLYDWCRKTNEEYHG